MPHTIAPLLSVTEAEQYLQQHYRWNFVVNALDGAFFTLGLSFVSTTVVLPLFVHHLVSAPLAVALLPAIANAGWLLPQILTVRYVESLPRNKPFVLRASAMERFQWWMLAPLTFLSNRVGSIATLAIFYGLFVWWALGGGYTGTAWQTMIARIIPRAQRGRFFGVQGTLGGFASVGGTFIATAVLQRYSYPTNFAVCFFLGGACLILSYGFLALTREPAIERPSAIAAPQSVFIRQLGALAWSNKAYRRLLAGRSLAILAAMPIGYMPIYAITQFDANPGQLGRLAAVLQIAQVSCTLLWGLLGDGRGHRTVLAWATGIGGIGALALLTASAACWLYPAFALFGITIAGTTVGGINSVLDIAPAAERPRYVALTASLIALPTCVAPLLGGWIVNTLGYAGLFAISACCALLSYILLRYDG